MSIGYGADAAMYKCASSGLPCFEAQQHLCVYITYLTTAQRRTRRWPLRVPCRCYAGAMPDHRPCVTSLDVTTR